MPAAWSPRGETVQCASRSRVTIVLLCLVSFSQTPPSFVVIHCFVPLCADAELVQNALNADHATGDVFVCKSTSSARMPSLSCSISAVSTSRIWPFCCGELPRTSPSLLFCLGLIFVALANCLRNCHSSYLVCFSRSTLCILSQFTQTLCLVKSRCQQKPVLLSD